MDKLMENEIKSKNEVKNRKEKEYKEQKEEEWNLYEKWFYRNCDSNNKVNIDIIISRDYDSKSPPQYEDKTLINNDNNPYVYKKGNFDYAEWFKRHSFQKDSVKYGNSYICNLEETKEEEEKQRIESEENFQVYTTFCKKYYPFIIKPINKTKKNICGDHFKIFSFFCLACNSHFCIECKINHIGHSFINLEQIEIKEEELIKSENLVKIKISQLFNGQFDEKTCEILKKYEEEIIKFNYFIINSYRNEKNNFYKYFNYYYLFRLEEDLKNREENNLFKLFFGFYGFKTLIYDLKNYYEKQKMRWLLKNLIVYKRNEIKKKIINKRKEDYNFENIYVLLQNEGFEEIIINKMKEIIIEVKNRNDLKTKIFDFIVESIDAFKNKKNKFLKELNVILEQVKVNFKEMVKQKVGNTEDVRKFLKKENCNYYVENNNKNNKYICDYEEKKENNTSKE